MRLQHPAASWLGLLVAVLVMSLTTPAFAAKLPSNLLLSPKASPHYVILVEKASQRLFVYHFDGTSYRRIAVYPCATGENPGDKYASGDRRTPEGIYFFTKAVGGRYLDDIYGERAFPMNYPNLIDRRRRKQGNGIWLHGSDPKEGLQARSTNGCVAMRNEDVVQMDRYIRLWDTPIIIVDTISYRDAHTLEREGNRLLALLEDWRRAWSSKDLERYLSYYSKDFRWRHLDFQGWRQKKARLNRRYRKIAVQLSDIRLFRHNNLVVATCDEIYRSDLFSSYGRKYLYLAQNSTEWRIVGEEWHKSRRPPPPPLVVAENEDRKMPLPEPPAEDLIRETIDKWRRAWERGDLAAYLTAYHPRFRSQGMDLKAWRRYKRALFRRAPRRDIDISNLRIEVDGEHARAVFIQDYREPRHQDRGVKTLRLRRHRGKWAIIGETWRPGDERS